MTTARLTTFILGLAALVAPARASLTYYCTSGCANPASDFATKATVTDGLVLSSPIDFTAALSQFGTVANDEYIDPTTQVEFISFNSTGTANEPFAPISGGVLYSNAGDSIEIILPANTVGIAVNFTTTNSGGLNLCVDPTQATLSSCDSNGTFIANGGSGFAGALNDNPSPAAQPSIWLSPTSGGADIDLKNFEIATESETPDAATGLTLGAGLVLISLLHRRARSLRSRQR
jgi:hypothetical protein